MKKTLNKIKAIITTLGIAIGSFCFKVMAQLEGIEKNGPTSGIADYYIVGDTHKIPSSFTSPWGIAIKVGQRALVVITVIVGIVNFLKIRKIDDKIQKKKKIRNSIIIISILIILLVAAFLVPTLLLKK